MAETLLVSQYIGRLLDRAGIPLHEDATASYAHLRAVIRAARNDTDELFADMWRFNRWAPRIGRALARAHKAMVAPKVAPLAPPKAPH
jgi:hypothetical protein